MSTHNPGEMFGKDSDSSLRLRYLLNCFFCASDSFLWMPPLWTVMSDVVALGF